MEVALALQFMHAQNPPVVHRWVCGHAAEIWGRGGRQSEFGAHRTARQPLSWRAGGVARAAVCGRIKGLSGPRALEPAVVRSVRRAGQGVVCRVSCVGDESALYHHGLTCAVGGGTEPPAAGAEPPPTACGGAPSLPGVRGVRRGAGTSRRTMCCWRSRPLRASIAAHSGRRCGLWRRTCTGPARGWAPAAAKAAWCARERRRTGALGLAAVAGAGSEGLRQRQCRWWKACGP
jgi:hypothetical protein